MNLRIGVLAFHGDVREHVEATKKAAARSHLQVDVVLVRTKEDLRPLRGLIIPGGESTTLQKLCEREGMWEGMKEIPAVFGTCAGAILLAKKIRHVERGQKTLGLMHIDIDRNAYGRQAESFEAEVESEFGRTRGVFIRAPRILHIGKSVRVLAKSGRDIVACEESADDRYYLASCFHPECTTTAFHEYFLAQILARSKSKKEL